MLSSSKQEVKKTMAAFQNHLRDFFARPGAPSQGEIAEKASIHRVNLNRIIRGHSIPSLDRAEAIAVATGTTLGRILKKSEKQELISS